MEIKEMMIAEQNKLDNRLEQLNKEYEGYKGIMGTLIPSKNGKYYKFYNYINGEKVHIPSNNKELVRGLAIKKYYKKTIAACESEKKAIEAYLSKVPKDVDPEIFFRNDALYSKILAPVFGETFTKGWGSLEYEKSYNHPENLIVPTLKGDLVRSKSEAAIADELFRNNLEYRYEAKLSIDSNCFYPDFMVMNKRGRILIWEHFGMMDDPGYQRKYFYKMEKYIKAGYVPTINMITTYETSDNPFSSLTAREAISTYFE
jgi:hypothetical protein